MESAGSENAPGHKPKQDSNSSTSSSTLNSDDYEVVPHHPQEDSEESKAKDKQPELAIVVGQGNEEDLKQNIKECLSPDEPPDDNETTKASAGDVFPENQGGGVKFSDEETSEDHTLFHNIEYLGSRKIEDPKAESDIQRHITDACQGADINCRKIVLSVPRTSDGSVVLHFELDEAKETFPICKIIFFARANVDGPNSSCFAYTSVHGDGTDDHHFQTHVFRCQMPEAVAKVFVSFAQAFKRSSPVQLGHNESFREQEAFLFELTLEVKEKEETKGTFENVPRQKGIFKLRSNVEKKVIISIQQISRNFCPLHVERCFGMLVSPGRNVRHADMQLLEKVTMATGATCTTTHGQTETNAITHVITGSWDPSETAFAVLNQETPADVQFVYITIAADLVVQQVTEPVRFVMEAKARIYPTNERYWYYTKKNLTKQYQMRLKRSKAPQGDKVFDVCGIDISEEIDRTKMSFTMQLANLTFSTLGSLRGPGSGFGSASDEPDLQSPQPDDDDDADEEAILSGFGDVSKDCSGTELEVWSQVLQEWDKDNPLQFPKQLPALVKLGVPEALRGEVWQRVTGTPLVMDDIVETYRILTTKESPDEKVILRDIHRTFPAHEFFKESGGVGQESLYRIAKAYSVYDAEVGYCQGQSFLIAALLLQMPEEQAFGVLVKVMHKWGLRDMFKENFEQLQLRLYQLDRLIETNMPDLWQHFADHGIESHMYASQWFLTIFTAKFPLFLVFRVLDCFLLLGFDVIFQVALGILKVAKKDLLTHDFEGLMKYFRVNIPKRYRSEENAKHLMAVATSIKLKKLAKYEKEWIHIKEQERAREDPLIRYERENKKLLSDNLRLDTENDNLARQLVNSKIEMRKDIDKIEDEKEYFEKEYKNASLLLEEALEEKKRLAAENEQLKTLLKREVDKLDAELVTRNNVIAEYKIITTQLNEKLEKAQQGARPTEAASESKEMSDQDDPLEKANARIRELELELAQTKLALVETECKFQDLTHQVASQSHSGGRGSTWFTKTLSSIKESAATAAAAHHQATVASRDSLKKSTSVDAIKLDQAKDNSK